MTLRRSVTLIVSIAAVVLAAACANSPTSPKGCDIITNGSGSLSC